MDPSPEYTRHMKTNRTYHQRYPKQLVVLTDHATKARLERLAEEWRRSRSEVTRLAIEAGLRVIDPEGEDVEGE